LSRPQGALHGAQSPPLFSPSQRRSASRGSPGPQGQVDEAARQLAARYTLAELVTRLADCTTLLQQADEAGTRDPGPVNLARFRRARAELEVAQRAVEIARSEPSEPR
jgi:hypothetical protein